MNATRIFAGFTGMVMGLSLLTSVSYAVDQDETLNEPSDIWQLSEDRDLNSNPAPSVQVGRLTSLEVDQMENDDIWQLSTDRDLNSNAVPSDKVGPLTRLEVDKMEDDDIWQLDQDQLKKNASFENTVIFGVDENLADVRKSLIKSA